ncbi:hypothetical protein N307_01880, partial [Dryobates pubescens]
QSSLEPLRGLSASLSLGALQPSCVSVAIWDYTRKCFKHQA